MYKILAIILLSGFTLFSWSQVDDGSAAWGTDSLNEQLVSDMEYADLGFLWFGDLSQDSRLGFTGDNYQRLQIRFVSVIKNYDNPFEYFLYGKSRTANHTCDLQGSLVIAEVGVIEDEEHPDLTRGYASGDYVMFEDQSCFSAGVYRGNFLTRFYIDKNGTFHYDDLDIDNPRFTNNEFTGDWEEYFSDTIRTANWGDRRIPDSGDLDAGEKAFYPAYKYQQYGWKEYLEERKKAEVGEKGEEWWKR
ncbi:MAG TPA: hypothetical protein VE870_16025 [Bacteroidales bacterium]|nr:hypothetical protein [Bacteroidales bacterium]